MADKDRRIIEMQFENKQFEKNIAQSTKSVEELKQAMDFEETSKGLKKFAESTKNLTIAGFDKFADNIQKITDKFTGLGTLSELVLSQIRRGIEQTAAKISNFISSMTTAQVSVGMDKYETLNKSVQTIKAATGKDEDTVYSVLKRLNDYTDQTSYNFSDMASNIGKFTSVGIDLESAERQMEGIANWAARSGAGIQEASRAMYNLSQAMGVGKLTKIDWKSIENAGMATKEFKEQLIAAGVAAGTLVEKQGKYFTKQGNTEVNFKNLADTLAKGWASSEVLSATLEKYHYSDLFYSIDDMLSNGGIIDSQDWKKLEDEGAVSSKLTEELLELGVEQKKLAVTTDKSGKKIYSVVDKTGKKIEFTMDNIQDSLDAGWLDKQLANASKSLTGLARDSFEAAQKCLTFTDVLGAWKDQISTGWMKSYTLIFGELSEAMEFFSDVCNRVGESIGSLIDFRNKVLENWNAAGGRQGLLDIIIGGYGDNTTAGAYGLLDVLEGAGNLIKEGFRNFIRLFMSPLDQKNADADPEYYAKWLGGLLMHITRSVKKFIKGIKTFFNEDITVNGQVTSRLEIIQNVVNGIAGAIKLAWDILSGAIGFISNIGTDLSPGFNELIGFFGDLGKSIYDTSAEAGKQNTIKTFFDNLRTDIKPVTDAVNTLFSSLAKLLRIIFGLDKAGATQTSKLESIGNIIRKIASIISKVVGPAIEFVSKIIDALGKLFKNGINANSLKEFGADIGKAFGEMVKSLADNLPPGLSFIKDWVDKLFGGGTQQVQNQANNLFGLINNTTKTANNLTNKAKKSQNNGPGIMGLMTGTNVAVWLGVASLVSVILLLRKARKVVSSIGGFFGTLGDTIKNGINIRYKDETFATKFLKIAGAIALISACVIALGLIPLPNLLQGVAAVVVIMGATFLLFKLLQKSFNQGSGLKDSLAFASRMTAMATSIAVLAVAIGLIALALIPFTLMSWDQFGKAMAGLGGILLELVAFMELVKLLKIGNVKLAGFAGFAIGIGLIVQGIVPFANMDWDQYSKAMAGLGGVLLQLIAFMFITSKASVNTKQLGSFVRFALSIAILVLAIRPFANMSWEQYGRVMAGLGGVLLQLIAFMWLIKQSGISNDALKFKGIIRFALAIVVLVQAIMPFKDMSWEQYGKVMAGLGGVLLELIAFMWLVKQSGITKEALKFNGIIKFALAIVVLIQAIMPFKDMTWDQYARVMAGLGGVLLEMIAFMWLFKQAGLSNKALSFSGILIFVAAIWMLITAIMPFKDLTWDQYALVMAGLGGLLLELVAFMGLMKLMKIEKDALAIAGAFPELAFGIQSLVNAILPFASMTWEEYAKAMAGLAGVLAIMLGFMAVMKFVKPSIKNMLQMAVFVGLFAAVAAAFAFVLTMLNGMDWKVIAAFSAGLSVLLVAFAAAGVLAKAAGIYGMVILAAGLALIMGVIALLAPLLIGSVIDALRDGAGSLAIISDLLGTFSKNMNNADEGGFDKADRIFDKLVGLFGKMAKMAFSTDNVNTLMYSMSALSLTATNIQKFDKKIKDLSDDGGAGKAQIIIGKFKNLLENDLVGFDAYIGRTESFYSALFNLGSAFDYFDNMTKDVISPDDNQGLQLIKQLAACAPDIDTIYKMDLDRLKDQLAELGGAMIIYAKGAESVNGGEIDDTTDVGGAVTLLHKISESFNQNGGFTIPSNMPTGDQLTEFGIQLAALAGALVAFEEAGKGLGDGTEKALATLDFFQKLKEKLEPGLGEQLIGAINAFKGNNGSFVEKDELTTFAEDIAQLGSAMAHFAASTQIVNEETKEVTPIDYSMATSALDAIADIQTKLPNVDGVLQVITGHKKSLTELAPEIGLLGDALSGLSDSTTKFNEKTGAFEPVNYENVNSFLGSIGELQKIFDENNLKNTFSINEMVFGNMKYITMGGTMDFGKLSGQLSSLGSGLKQLSDSITGTNREGKPNFDVEAIGNASSVLRDDIIPIMKMLREDLPEVGGLGTILSSVFTGRNLSLGGLGDELGKLGEGLGKLGTNLNTGSWADNSGVINAFASMDSLFSLIIKVQEFYSRMNDVQRGMPTWNAYTAFTGLSQFIQYLSEDNSGLVTNIGEFMQQLDTAIFTWSDDIGDDIDTVLKRMEAFKLFSEGMAALISTVDTDDRAITSWSYIGTKLTTDIAKAISTGMTSVVDAVTAMIKTAYAAGSNVPEANWHSLGTNIATGVEKGVKDAGPNHVTPAVRQMMLEAYEAGKRAIDSNSPSKLFMELGAFMGEGTAIGIKKSSGEVSDNAAEMGEIALDSAKDMIGLISRIMAEGTDASPTIAPILDMTNIDEGMSQFRESLNGYGINLDTSYSAGRASHIGTSGYEDLSALKPDYSGIYNEMRTLGTQIQQMGREIRNIKLVLDTGAVAGGVADILDEEFGRRSFYASRE